MNDIQQKISQINGQKIAEEMDKKGYILLSQFLRVKYCKGHQQIWTNLKPFIV